MTERKRPLRLIKVVSEAFFPVAYTAILLRALTHFSPQLSVTPPMQPLHPRPHSPPHYLVSFLCVRQVACQHPIITYSVFLSLLPPPACLMTVSEPRRAHFIES